MQRELEIAKAAAKEAGEYTLKYFDRPGTAVEIKADLSPVTEADKGAEKIIRAHLQTAFPDDSILGEEWGQQGENDQRRFGKLVFMNAR